MEGSFEHLEPRTSEPVLSSSADLRFQTAAAAADLASNRGIELAQIWQDIALGKTEISHCFFAGDRSLLGLTTSRRVTADRRLEPRRVAILERILLGKGQKSLAVELGVAPSTITLIAGECLRAMGLDCSSSRVPLPLVMAAHARFAKTDFTHGRASELENGGALTTVVSVVRPDLHLRDLLSPAEYVVTRLLVEGHRHAEIASLRNTSERTIANQLASAFHKLEVSGRAELLCRLISRERPALPLARLASPARRREAPSMVSPASR